MVFALVHAAMTYGRINTSEQALHLKGTFWQNLGATSIF
jgi:hypothetical protein